LVIYRGGCGGDARDARDARDAGDAISAFSRKSLAKSFPPIGAANWVKGFFAGKKALTTDCIFIKFRTQP